MSRSMNTKYAWIIVSVLVVSLALNGYFFWRINHHTSRATEYAVGDVRGAVWYLQNADYSLQSARDQNWENEVLLWQAAQSLEISGFYLRRAAHTATLADTSYRQHVKALRVEELDALIRQYEDIVSEQAEISESAMSLDTDMLEIIIDNLETAKIPISPLENDEEWQALITASNKLMTIHKESFDQVGH